MKASPELVHFGGGLSNLRVFERHTQSTLGADLMSFTRGISEFDWMRSLFAEAIFEDYSLEQDESFRECLKTIVTVDNEPIYEP